MKDFLFTDLISFVGEAPKKFDGYKKYVSTGAVNGNIIESDDIELVDYSSRPSRANLVACSGDILFAKMAETEKTLLLDDETEKNIYSTGFCAIRAKENIIEPKALYYLLGSSLFLNQKNTNSSGATQRAITNTGLSKIRIKLPTMEKQREFCGIMDKVVDSIELRKKQLGYFDKFTKSLFIELFGDPVENERQWPTLPLQEICTAIVDCPHSTPNYIKEDTGYMCIRTSIVKKNRILWDEIEFIPEREYVQRIQRKRPSKGDIVYTREGAILGIAAVIDRECNVALGQRSMLLSPDTSQCVSQFLCMAMNFDSFLRQALGRISGSASPHINVGDIKEFAIITPPMRLQEQFASFVEQTDKSKLAVKKSLEELEILKKSLMQKYFA